MNTLLENLLARIPAYTYPINPRKREQPVAKDPAYLHISNHYFQDKEGKLVRRGITYRKEN